MLLKSDLDVQQTHLSGAEQTKPKKAMNKQCNISVVFLGATTLSIMAFGRMTSSSFVLLILGAKADGSEHSHGHLAAKLGELARGRAVGRVEATLRVSPNRGRSG